MEKIILSNFLETQESFEQFNIRTKHSLLSTANDILGVLQDESIDIDQKCREIAHYIMNSPRDFKTLLSCFDYSTTEQKMLLFCYDSTDRDDLVKLLMEDFKKDISNINWYNEIQYITQTDEIYNTLLERNDNDGFSDFYEDTENKIIYFVEGDALIYYVAEAGGFGIFKISDYSDLKTYIDTNYTVDSMLVDAEFTEEFISQIDYTNPNDYENINNFTDKYLTDEYQIEVNPNFVVDEIEVDINIELLKKLIITNTVWTSASTAFLHMWYDVDEDTNEVLTISYPWNASFDDFIFEIQDDINKITVDIVEQKFFDEQNNYARLKIIELDRLSNELIINNFIESTKKYIVELKDLQIESSENSQVSELINKLNLIICDPSVEYYLNYLSKISGNILTKN